MTKTETNYKIFEFESIDSTNNEARRMLENGSVTCPFAIIANRQTNGRGRQGKSFYSPENTGLYMTVVFECNDENDLTFFTSAAAVAVSDVLDLYTGKNLRIKWVNDIYLDDRKVCGILCESVFAGHPAKRCIITGIGINLTTEAFPDDISNSAGSVGEINISKSDLAKTIADGILNISKNANTEDIYKKYTEKSLVIGKNIRFLQNNVWYDGFASGIDRRGRLEVDLPSGEKTKLSGGEITLRLQ